MEPEDIAQSFRILRKCQNEFDCLTFEMFFLNQRTETNAKQTVRFSSCKTICLQQILLRLFYFSIVVHFNAFLHIVSHFSGRHIFIYTYNMFLHIYANLENFTHLKMTSERSKRRDVLALVLFISK